MKKLCLIGLIVCVFNASGLFAQDWNIQTVDNSGDVGKWCEVAYDDQGYPHIAYYNETDSWLMYARWNGKGWEIEKVGERFGTNKGEYCSIAVDQFGKINQILMYFYLME